MTYHTISHTVIQSSGTAPVPDDWKKIIIIIYKRKLECVNAKNTGKLVY